MPHEMPEEKLMRTKEQALEFVAQALLPATNKQTRCVDGRYESAENMPAVARPVADVGYLQVALAMRNYLHLPLSREEMIVAVFQLVGGKENFSYHTDSHHEHDANLCAGCGHFARAAENLSAYSLTKEDVAFIEKTLRTTVPPQQRTVLDGNHEEQAVMVVSSEGFSLKSKTPDGHQAFIYQKTLDEKNIEKLADMIWERAEEAHISGELKGGKEMIRTTLEVMSQRQTAKTLELLAKGKSLFQVSINNKGEFEITEEPSVI